MKHRLALLLLASCVFLGSCGGSTTPAPPQAQDPPGEPASAGSLQSQVLRTASGLPTGIHLMWPPVMGSGIVGYHLYKSAEPIPATARGDDSLWFTVGGDPLIPQSPGLEQPVEVDDFFSPAYGEIWYYRLATVDADGDESRLGGEEAVEILPFEIYSVEPDALPVGDNFTITGRYFGVDYDAEADHVDVSGVVWVDDVGFMDLPVAAEIVNWQPSLIEATLPLGATSGPVSVGTAGFYDSSEDILTNSDPYITSLTPLAASMADVVILEGANFGDEPGRTFGVVVDGDVIPVNNYVQYNDDLISFYPPNVWPDFGPKDVFVRVQGGATGGDRDSNVGYLDVTNAPPIAALFAEPVAGPAPLTVNFDATGSLDPEGTSLTFDYDWEGDAAYDLLDGGATPSHRYMNPGQYFPVLRATDEDGGVGTRSLPIDVTASNLEFTDNDSPGDGEYFTNPAGFTMRYQLAGGMPPCDIDWVLISTLPPSAEYALATDTGLGAGPGMHVFDIDTTTTVVTEGSNTIPLGSWWIRGEASDQTPDNDPDPTLTWPTDEGRYEIYRYDIGIIHDNQGDSDGVESDTILNDLAAMGYLTTWHESAGLPINALIGHHAIIWAANGPHGSAGLPYTWLDATDLALIMAFEDLGGSAIIFGPPEEAREGQPFPADPIFGGQYQPFAGCGLGPISTVSFTPQNYTADYQYLVTLVDYQDNFGHDGGVGLYGGCTTQLTWFDGFDTYIVAGTSYGPLGGKTYFGMFIYTLLGTLQPAGVTKPQLLDNIVAGTINEMPPAVAF